MGLIIYEVCEVAMKLIVLLVFILGIASCLRVSSVQPLPFVVTMIINP